MSDRAEFQTHMQPEFIAGYLKELADGIPAVVAAMGIENQVMVTVSFGPYGVPARYNPALHPPRVYSSEDE